MTSNPNYIAPQSASAPITTNLRKDELAALNTVDQGATAQQRVVAIGNSIPLVFCRFVNNVGGAWVTPPAARYGLQLTESASNSFSFGLVLSDGQVPAVAASDIYKGALSLGSLISPNAVTTFDGLATTGFDYSLTYTTAGTPGTPGTPGSFTDTTLTASGASVSSVFSASYANVKSASISLQFQGRVATTLAYEAVAGNATISHSSFGVSQQFFSVTTVSLTVPGPFGGTSTLSISSGVDAAALNPRYVSYRVVYNISYVTSVFTPGTPATPGTPGVTSNLLLFAGSGGSFAGMTTLAVRGTYAASTDIDAVKQQVRCFIRNGVIVSRVLGGTDSSDSFPDLVNYLLTRASSASSSLIDLPSLQAAEYFTSSYGLRFNGVVANSVNLRDYFSRVSPFFLLRFVQINGKFGLKPVLPLLSDYSLSLLPIVPAFTFNDNNIVAGSFQKQYISTSDRKPFCALMTWRSQSTAFFGVPQTTEVRYAGTAVNGPFEQYDMEEFCTTADHAAFVGKYIIASRKHVTHTVSFQTTEFTSNLVPTDIVRVTWDYGSSFALGEATSVLYQVDSVSEGADGVFRVEATHFPTTATGASQVAFDMFNII